MTDISITCNSWDPFPPSLPPPWVCTVTISFYIRERNTLNTLNWFEYTIIILLCKDRGGEGGIWSRELCLNLCYPIRWLIFPLPVTLDTLSLLCLLPESALSSNHATLGRGIHSIHWAGLNTQLLCYSVKNRGRTYDPGICVLICYVILHFKLTNISIICNSWVSFPVSLCLLPESALSPHHTTLGRKNILPQQEIVLTVQLWFLSWTWTFLSTFCCS